MKRHANYGTKVSWIVKRYGKYRRKVTWIVKRYGKCGRKVNNEMIWKMGRNLWNDMENMEKRQVEQW